MKKLEIKPLSEPVRKTVSIPGSKSITNRALVLAALTKGNVTINHPLTCDDTQAMIDCLQTLGIAIEKKAHLIVVKGDYSQVKNRTHMLNAKLSGTTMRFILALCCIVPGIKILTGEEGLLKRPIKDLVDALRQLNVEITYLDQEGFPPIRVESRIIYDQLKSTKKIAVNTTISSQFLSALLTVAPLVKDLHISTSGKLISQSYVALTKDMMQSFGVKVKANDNSFSTKGTYNLHGYTVEGDYSSAAYIAAIAAITKSTITLKNLNPNSSQGDKEFLNILEQMGNKIIYSSNKVRSSQLTQTITVVGSGIKPVTVNMQNCPDQIQTLAVLAAFAKGTTKISGIASLRVKETDRLYAITTELAKMGIKTTIDHDTLVINGGNPHAATIDTYGDHRMAMSFAIAGSVLEGIKINDPDVVSKTFPDFWKQIKKVGLKINIVQNKPNIALIGFMCSGKSTISPVLAKKLNYKIEDIDEIVKKIAHKKTEEIFAEEGEAGYRAYEMQAAKLIQGKRNIIISTGGGSIMKNKTMNYLQENSIIVFLDTDFQTILKRLSPKMPRPMFKNPKQASALYNLRLPLYKKYADIVVTTDNKTPSQIADEIVQKLGGIL